MTFGRTYFRYAVDFQRPMCCIVVCGTLAAAMSVVRPIRKE